MAATRFHKGDSHPSPWAAGGDVMRLLHGGSLNSSREPSIALPTPVGRDASSATYGTNGVTPKDREGA